MNNYKLPSPVEKISWREERFYVKRDDLIDPLLSGNKLRKLHFFLNEDLRSYKEIISYGGIQSNAMLSIARLAQIKEVPFVYYVRYLPKIDTDQESNYTIALRLGMEVRIKAASSDEALGEELRLLCDESTLLIPQGGASQEARYGVDILADEIRAWKKMMNINELYVATPSGTGTTALWLQMALKEEAKVLTTAVVGTSSYLLKQMQRLSHAAQPPWILETQKNYTFAKPHKELLNRYNELLKLGIEFDLIYAPVMFQALDENREIWEGKTILYVHSGGVLGNTSQKARYY